MIRVGGEKGIKGQHTRVVLDAYGRVIDADNPTTVEDFGITDAVVNGKGTPTIISDVYQMREKPSPSGLG